MKGPRSGSTPQSDCKELYSAKYFSAKWNLLFFRPGVPQGSFVAPGLFLIYVSKPPTGQCQILQYADDIALYYQSSIVGLAIEKLRQGAEILTSWLDTNEISINHYKSKFLLFANKRTAGALTITIKNTELKQEEDVKFLGMTINKKLNWNSHIKEITKKVAPEMAALKILAQLKMCRKNLPTVYNSYIRSHFTYSIAARINLPKTLTEKSQRIQNQSLSICLNSNFRLSVKRLHKECDINIVREEQKRQVRSYIERCYENKNHKIFKLY